MTDTPPQDALAALPPPATSVEARDRLVAMLRRDLIGPHPDLDPDLKCEVLAGTPPSTWYLTGYLVPKPDAEYAPGPEDQAELDMDKERATEGLGVDAEADADDDDTAPVRRSFMPSSMGLSFLVPEATRQIGVKATWGDYRPQPPLPEALIDPDAADEDRRAAGATRNEDLTWHRVPGEASLTLDVPDAPGTPGEKPLEGSMVRGGALTLFIKWGKLVEIDRPGKTPVRARQASVFLVNRRPHVARRFSDIVNAHQVRLELSCEGGFAPMPDRTGYASDDADDRLADLHYRDVMNYGAGHNTSIDWDEDGARLWTDPLPTHEVLTTRADMGGDIAELGMEALGVAADEGADALRAALSNLPTAYADWAREQTEGLDALPDRRREVAETCLAGIAEAQGRIETGLRRLYNDATAREAFAVMNRTVAAANRQRVAQSSKTAPADVKPPKWRLFQLAFILLNLEGLSDRLHEDRAVVDLLFFPTGGGKTEAYLGLAAFTIARRRLDNPGLTGAGLSVLMRYTLRLLTLDQLSRAAGVICALELERKDRGRLGDWPIEIGLWVGGGATPNRFGGGKDKKDGTLVGWLAKMRQGGPPPIPLTACPWCGSALAKENFHPKPSRDAPRRLDIVCDDIDCRFSEDRLPIVTVDEEVYRRLPAFMIATIDKFAGVPWEGRTGAFFGHVDRYDDTGFYGAAEPGVGRPLDQDLPPMDLVVQDELHLISGPLGTVAGLYETAFDLLSSRIVNNVRRGPKIVASTATVRRAEDQVRSLFGREHTAIFPPPGPSRDDSFFASTNFKTPGRLYVGVGAPGAGPKRVFLRGLQTLLAGAKFLSNGGSNDPADPYLTALCYFNALRELGGARRIVDDEVRRNLSHYGRDRRRAVPEGGIFHDRSLRELEELTSRVSTAQVAEARAKLGRASVESAGTDIALATNMISVGLDIPRLGLMVLQGQPKTSAEYIQATSRVGRDPSKPGLVVALLNLHRPRDRSHYEKFRSFHASFYRMVEATGVTPFAPRALDRALAAVLVAVARHIDTELTPSGGAISIAGKPEIAEQLEALLREKLAIAGETAPERVITRMHELLKGWEQIAQTQGNSAEGLRYDGKDEQGRLLRDPLRPLANDPDGTRNWFGAARSMRETEPVAMLTLVQPDGRSLDKAANGGRR